MRRPVTGFLKMVFEVFEKGGGKKEDQESERVIRGGEFVLSGGFYGNLLRRAFTGDLLLGGGLLLGFFYGGFHSFLWAVSRFFYGVFMGFCGGLRLGFSFPDTLYDNVTIQNQTLRYFEYVFVSECRSWTFALFK